MDKAFQNWTRLFRLDNSRFSVSVTADLKEIRCMQANQCGMLKNLSHREVAILVIAAALSGAAFNIIPDGLKFAELPIKLLIPAVISIVAIAFVIIDKRRCATPASEQPKPEA